MQRSLRLAALLTPLLATPAFAVEEGGLMDINTGLMAWTILIFLIVLAVLYKLAFPHILGAVEAREQHIRELLAAAARDREEAQALLEQQKAEIEGVRGRAQEMMAEGREAGERLREEILAQARREQEEILERTRRDVRGEIDRALEEMRADAVDLAIAAASRLLQRSLDDEENRRLVSAFIQEVDADRDAPLAAGV